MANNLWTWPEDLVPTWERTGTWFIVIAALFVVAQIDYFLFHAIAEGFAIIIAALIYVLATRTYKYSGNNYLLFLGIAYFFIAVIDFFHLITYTKTGIFLSYGPDIPTQLWVAGRYLEALSLFIAPLITRRKFSYSLVFLTYAVVTGFLLGSIMGLKVFPTCYIDGQGLTVFKVVSEYIICLLLVGGILQLALQREEAYGSLKPIIITAMTVFIASELSFTLYNDVFGLMNFVGHIFKVIAYFLVCWGVVLQGLNAPYDSIFRQLKASAIFDKLTGLYNRQGFLEFAGKEIARGRLEGRPLGFLLLDLDKFKRINDNFGHQAGDKVLKHFAQLIRSSIREIDIACRLGGDEFMVLVNDDGVYLEQVGQKIRDGVVKWTAADTMVGELGVSIGSTLWKPGDPEDIDNIIKQADDEMYREKEAKKYSRL